MSETYKGRLARKAARLAEISAELDSLHAQATGLLGGPDDPHEALVLGQLGEARRALAEHLPATRAALAEAETTGAYGAEYIARTYGGRSVSSEQGGFERR